MSAPIEVDIPHQLGKEVVRTRLDGGIGKIGRMIPGGAQVDHRWEGDSMFFTLRAMGQSIGARCDVGDANVHAVIDLPGFLALFADKIRAAVQQQGPKLLE